MKTVNCPFCGAVEQITLYELRHNLTGSLESPFRVVQCENCQGRFTNPQPMNEEWEQYYPPDYPAYRLRVDDGDHLDAMQRSINRRLARVAKKRAVHVTTLMDRPLKGLRLLDVGCGGGSFLTIASQCFGAIAAGMDFSPEAVEQTKRSNPALKVFTGTLHDVDIPNAEFHVITMWHVLEHEPRPVEALRRAKQLLTPGGLLVVEVPNSQSRMARFWRQYWIGWDVPRHLIHFTPDSLHRAAENAGLEVQKVIPGYTLGPVVLSPSMASGMLALRARKKQWKMTSLPPYAWMDRGLGAAPAACRVLERILGDNALILAARKAG